MLPVEHMHALCYLWSTCTPYAPCGAHARPMHPVEHMHTLCYLWSTCTPYGAHTPLQLWWMACSPGKDCLRHRLVCWQRGPKSWTASPWLPAAAPRRQPAIGCARTTASSNRRREGRGRLHFDLQQTPPYRPTPKAGDTKQVQQPSQLQLQVQHIFFLPFGLILASLWPHFSLSLASPFPPYIFPSIWPHFSLSLASPYPPSRPFPASLQPPSSLFIASCKDSKQASTKSRGCQAAAAFTATGTVAASGKQSFCLQQTLHARKQEPVVGNQAAAGTSSEQRCTLAQCGAASPVPAGYHKLHTHALAVEPSNNAAWALCLRWQELLTCGQKHPRRTFLASSSIADASSP